MPLSKDATPTSSSATNCLTRARVLEPVGSATPKFSSDSKSLGTFEKIQNGVLALLCPAQGFPLPNYRYYQLLQKPVLWHFPILDKSARGKVPLMLLIVIGEIFFKCCPKIHTFMTKLLCLLFGQFLDNTLDFCLFHIGPKWYRIKFLFRFLIFLH